jgi:hypothetical protein
MRRRQFHRPLDPSRGCEETLLKEILVRNFTLVGRRSLAGMRCSTYSHHAVDSNCEFHGNPESSERLEAAGGGWKTNLVLITAAITLPFPKPRYVRFFPRGKMSMLGNL